MTHPARRVSALLRGSGAPQLGPVYNWCSTHAAATASATAAVPPAVCGPRGRLYALLEHNRAFVARRGVSELRDAAAPLVERRVVVVSCMDTRLTHLLPAALGLRAGEAKHIKNAGAVITHPFGGIMRSVMVALYALDADEVFVVGHHDCGMTKIEPAELMGRMEAKGIKRETLEMLGHAGVDVAAWLEGFKSVEESVANSVGRIRNHPLTPSSVPVHGLIIDPTTGALDLVVNGYKGLAPPVAEGSIA